MIKNIQLKPINCLFLLLLAFQCLAIIYINLFENQNQLGYDASANYLKAMEMWRQGTLFPEFHETTALLIDSSIPFATLLYGMTGNIFVSYGIVNIIIAALIVIVYLSLVKHLNKTNFLSTIIPLNLLLSPLLVDFEFGTLNPICDIYNLMFVSAAFYNVKMLTGFLCVLALLNLGRKTNKGDIFLVIITFIMTFISGMSYGMYQIVTFLLPLTIFLAIKTANTPPIHTFAQEICCLIVPPYM
jgi:hypothetical protein